MRAWGGCWLCCCLRSLFICVFVATKGGEGVFKNAAVPTIYQLRPPSFLALGQREGRGGKRERTACSSGGGRESGEGGRRDEFHLTHFSCCSVPWPGRSISFRFVFFPSSFVFLTSTRRAVDRVPINLDFRVDLIIKTFPHRELKHRPAATAAGYIRSCRITPHHS